MPVEEFAGHLEGKVRASLRDRAKYGITAEIHCRTLGIRVGPVDEGGTDRAKSLFEGDEAVIFAVRPAHVQLLHSKFHGFLDGVPDKQGHAAERVKTGITAAVLIDHGLFVGESKDACDWLIILGGDPDFQLVAKELYEGSKPSQRLRGQAVTATGTQEKQIKFCQDRFRVPFFTFQPFPIGPANPLLERCFVEARKNFGSASIQEKTMRAVDGTLRVSIIACRLIGERSNLDGLSHADAGLPRVPTRLSDSSGLPDNNSQ